LKIQSKFIIQFSKQVLGLEFLFAKEIAKSEITLNFAKKAHFKE